MTTRSRTLSATLVLTVLLASAASALASLDDYVKKDDPTFAWELIKTESSPLGSATHIKLTSQTWQGITWVHHLQIYEPTQVVHQNAALLFITGGSNENLIRKDDAEMGFALAKLCGARVCVLPQVPNQPLLGGKTEDTLIAETFIRYLETKDANWPLLFPMVKSAVKAMDAVQQWSHREGKPEPKQFIVTGASKRGWTTWLTGASDPRVAGIAPMVIDTLNMKAQTDHALEVWGKYSEQIDDYTSRGLTKRFDDPEGKKLWQMVDPYSYRSRLSIPKFLINGANDRYWTLDALNIYWDDLKTPKYVVYLPNAGHDLAVHRDYALNGIGAFFRSIISHRPFPNQTWTHSDSNPNTLRLAVTTSVTPKSARLWVITADSRDFRDSVWQDSPLTVVGNLATGETPRPATGYIALMGDLEYEFDGIPFHLSTQIRQTGVNPKAAK